MYVSLPVVVVLLVWIGLEPHGRASLRDWLLDAGLVVARGVGAVCGLGLLLGLADGLVYWLATGGGRSVVWLLVAAQSGCVGLLVWLVRAR
jgi:hypothetical protein